LPVLIISQKERVVLYANKYAQIQYGIPIDKLRGSTIDEVYTIKGQEGHLLECNTRNAFTQKLEVVIKPKYTHEFIAFLSISPIIYQNKKCYLGMVMDISKQKEIEYETRRIHNQTSDSIDYASLIQSALLPDNKLIKQYFSDQFIIWHPKYPVGGDIYLFSNLRHKDECLLMVIDCMGLGVSGAFVTMLVKAVETQIISRIINDKDANVSPACIMEYLRKTLKQLVKQENKNSISNAGVDGAIIYYNKKEKIIKFTGAGTPLFYVDLQGELHIIKGDRYSVGYKKYDTEHKYKESTIYVEKGMKFYCSTDGYFGQMGGEKGFPFSKKRFTNIIREYHQEPMAEQQEIFLYEMAEYEEMAENNERNDDMTLIGFTI